MRDMESMWAWLLGAFDCEVSSIIMAESISSICSTMLHKPSASKDTYYIRDRIRVKNWFSPFNHTGQPFTSRFRRCLHYLFQSFICQRRWSICKHSGGGRSHFAIAKSKQFSAQKTTEMQTVAALISSIVPIHGAEMKTSNDHPIGSR